MTDPIGPTPHAEDDNATDDLTEEVAVLIEEVVEGPRVAAFEFYVVNDEKAGIYEAVVGDAKIAGLPYDVVGDHRVVLLATSVFPEFRKQGVATELIRRVLDDVRAQGKTVTAMCPIVRTFIQHNAGYADLVDPEYPGVNRRAHRR
jgi:uncharacterized protein